MLRRMADHLPRGDSTPPAPDTWEDIPLGIGQEPNAMGHDGAFQVERRRDPRLLDSVRRAPDENWEFIIHTPERP